jgi:hypothetical protein
MQSFKNGGIRELHQSARKQVINNMQLSTNIECSICFMGFEEGQMIDTLDCFSTHVFHQECMDGYIKFHESDNKPCECPLCRKEIDKSKITVNEYRKNEVEDPFDL